MIETASRHRAPARCIWLDTPLAQAQVNLVERLLDRFGALPTPEELRSSRGASRACIAPTSQMRAFRELEPPSDRRGLDGRGADSLRPHAVVACAARVSSSRQRR